MCIIVAKNKNIDMPSKEVLKRCFNSNRDGAGYMYVKNGKVYINKGFMDFDSFYNSIEKLGKIYDLKKHALVMHFRISTGGNVDGGNCHPYPITSNEEYLRRKHFVTDLGMCHNGTISHYSGGWQSKEVLNDTQKFIKNFVSVLKDMDNDFLHNRRAMELIEDIAGSKLCFLDSDEKIHLVGNFIKDNGVYYSNSSYLDYYSYPMQQYNRVGNGSYQYESGYYDDEPYNGSYSNYYKDYQELYLDENMIMEGQIEPLTQEQFDTLMENLTPLYDGEVVILGNLNEYVVGENNKYYIDLFNNLYCVDSKRLIIGLIDEDVVVLEGF